jgi:hypothetical protein
VTESSRYVGDRDDEQREVAAERALRNAARDRRPDGSADDTRDRQGRRDVDVY